MSERRLLYIVACAIILVSLYWAWFDRVSVLFTIQPGGADVIVKVNGRTVASDSTSSKGNLYSLSLKHGGHLIMVEKPGYISLKQLVNVRWGDGDKYPVFPPLQRMKEK